MVMKGNICVLYEKVEQKAVDIGMKAWQIGGLGCMKYLHEMAMDICWQKYPKEMINDYIQVWWDGIGNWRCKDLFENLTMNQKEA